MNLMFLDTAASTTTDMGASMIGLVLPMVILIAMMYFVLYRPQKKQQKKDAEMRNSIEIGDEVTTIGGVIGRVVAIKEDTFVLETGSDRVKIRFRRSAIGSVEKLNMEAEKTDAKKADKKADK
ncbi:preprotein translocase subunit YajC [Anaerofilum sp. An201]|nr:preprotein translocase subunit YajC [Anaerofilum sp. An201]